MLKDIDIRLPLIDKIKKQNEGNSYRIIPEMSVCDGAARIDVAVANGKLYGYEIKSNADTLDRLSFQTDYYNKTFDKMIIVIGDKFIDKIENFIPDWWGILLAIQDKNGLVVIKERRPAKHNNNINAQSLLELLWRDEIATLLKIHGFKCLSGKNRRVLRKMAAENLSLKIIRDFTRETLKERIDWRNN